MAQRDDAPASVSHYAVPPLTVWVITTLLGIIGTVAGILAWQVFINTARLAGVETTLKEHEWRFETMKSADAGIGAAIIYQSQRIDDILKDEARQGRCKVEP